MGTFKDETEDNDRRNGLKKKNESINSIQRAKDVNISDLGIDELRRIFDFEIDRSNSLESKAAAIFGFAALVVTILIFIMNYFLTANVKNLELFTVAIFSSASIIIIFFSLIYLLKSLRIRDYPIPFDFNPNNIREYLIRSPDEIKNEMMENYRRSISKISIVNKQKANSLNNAIILLLIGVLLSIIMSLSLIWIRILM